MSGQNMTRTKMNRTLSSLALSAALLSTSCALDTLEPCEGETCENLDEKGLAIVGGSTAAAHAWPSAVGIWDTKYREVVLCGGTLVHPKWVLTATHCVNDLPLSEVELVLGTRDISGTTSGYRVTPIRSVLHATIDLALLELPSRTSYRTSDWFTSGELASLALTQPATAVGWGSTTGYYTEGASVPLLQQVNLEFRGRGSACNSFFPATSVPSSELCLGPGDALRDTCFGDSGGSSSFRFGGAWKSAGVVKSGGPLTGAGKFCANPGRPSLFTIPDVAWLKAQLPASEGKLRVERSDGLGNTTLQSTKAGTSSHADIIVVGQFAAGALGDVLQFDARAGSFTVQKASDTAVLTTLAAQTGLPTGLTLIGRGKINGDAYDDLIVFDAVNKRLRAYSANAAGTGVFTALGTGLVVADGSLRNLIVGKFDSDTNLDFMTYSPSLGEGRFYEVSSAGTIKLVRANSGWNRDWEIIFSGN